MPASEAIYDESQVPKYQLPDPLRCTDGSAAAEPSDWCTRRRPEILALFQEEMYGRTPPADAVRCSFREMAAPGPYLNGTVERRQVAVDFSGAGADQSMEMLIYLPAQRSGPVPIFVGLSFYGNHTVQMDPAVALSSRWMRDDPDHGVVGNRATEASRGTSASRWSVERLIARGYGLATMYCGDLDPDYDDGFQNGVQPLCYRQGQSRPEPDQWGAIGAWAWGLSRALDYFETDPDIDHKRVAVMGHSRLGKTALWAGAQDERFALTISNNSGCGGAALSRRCFGETIARITTAFPHWFCGRFAAYAGREPELPVDQHMLIALMAPRPVYVASAVEDSWADPRGEFLSALHADPVYRLLGTDGMAASQMPELESPVTSRIGYHIRRGGHNVTPYDWDRWMDFADLHME
jgi:hypothetical protein